MGSLRYMSSPTTGKMPYQAGVPPVKQVLNQTRNQLVTLITFTPPLHTWPCLVRPIIIAAHMVHTQMRLLLTPLPPAACLTLSSTVKDNQQGLSSQVDSFMSYEQSMLYL